MHIFVLTFCSRSGLDGHNDLSFCRCLIGTLRQFMSDLRSQLDGFHGKTISSFILYFAVSTRAAFPPAVLECWSARSLLFCFAWKWSIGNYKGLRPEMLAHLWTMPCQPCLSQTVNWLWRFGGTLQTAFILHFRQTGRQSEYVMINDARMSYCCEKNLFGGFNVYPLRTFRNTDTSKVGWSV